MKKFVSTILAALMLFSVSAVALAAENVDNDRVAHIESNVSQFLNDIGESQSICEYIPLNNFGDELEALFFPLSEGGYVVASYKDGHVIEYSPDNLPSSPMGLSSDAEIYYGGPLSFYTKINGQFMDVVAGTIHEDNSIYYSKDYKSEIEPAEAAIAGHAQATAQSTPLLAAPSNYVSASGGWYCTITGITNLLQYYKDNFGAIVYPQGVTSISGLRTALNHNNYIYNGPLFLRKAASVHTMYNVEYLGLRSYLGRADVTTYAVMVTTITPSKVKSQIDNYSRPVLLHINTSSIDSGAAPEATHIVFCYGYWETSMTTYFIVNNGWGSNGVYVCADDIPSSYEMLYLQR